MQKSQTIKQAKLRAKRSLRVRSKLNGCSARPRLSVIRTNQHIHVQLIDDEKSITLASTSTLSKEFRGTEFSRKNKTSAKKLGEKIAELAQAKQVQKIIFDRGEHKYHGVIAAVAEGAREKGLEF